LLPHSDYVKTGQSESVNDELKSLHLQDTEYDTLRIPPPEDISMLLKF